MRMKSGERGTEGARWQWERDGAKAERRRRGYKVDEVEEKKEEKKMELERKTQWNK